MNLIVKFFMPTIKKIILNKIQDEQFQEKLIEKILEKVDLPVVSKKEEKKFVNQLYDAVQEILVEMVNNYK